MNRTMRQNTTVAMALVLAVLLAACSSTTGKSLGRDIDDATITAEVKAKLAAEKIATLTRIDVDTNNGVVALNGTVQSEDMRMRAVDVARGVKGVREVVNNLRVQSS